MTAWPADTVERRAVSALLPYARNSRTHTDAQVAQIAASIKEFGWTMPILIDETGTIIAGHARVLAAKKLAIAEVPVMVARGWSEAQRKAYVVADNQLALGSGWDNEILSTELSELKASEFNLELLGFTAPQLEEIMAPAPAERPSNGAVNFVVSYNLVFDDEAQQAVWFSFVRFLKVTYPNEPSLGAMLAKFIRERDCGQG